MRSRPTIVIRPDSLPTYGADEAYRSQLEGFIATRRDYTGENIGTSCINELQAGDRITRRGGQLGQNKGLP